MGYFLPYLLAAVSAVGLWLGGSWTWLGVIMFISVNVVLDEVVKDRTISSPVLRRLIFNRKLGQLSICLSPILLTGYLVFGLWRMQSFGFGLPWLGALISMCNLFGSVATNAGHELMHRQSWLQRAMGIWNLALVNYAPYRISHIEVHHHYVGTDIDPSTPKPGASSWSFMRDCFLGTLRMSFMFEKHRVGVFSLRNRNWHYVLLMLAFTSFLGMWLGALAVVAWFIISAMAIASLVLVDYVEHRGVERRPMQEDGSCEPIQGKHCVDCYHLISNLLFLNVGHHANHHIWTANNFTNLFPDSGATQTKHGYAYSVLRAFVGMDQPVAPAAEMVEEDIYEPSAGSGKRNKVGRTRTYIDVIRSVQVQRS